MRDVYTTLNRILRTEKGTLQAEKNGKYFFDVDTRANKFDIKHAIEKIYKVKVSRVNTQIMPRKPKTLRLAQGHTKEWKKAIVTLESGQKIDLAT